MSKRGLIINPSSNVLKVDTYPDADFMGMYGHGKMLVQHA